MQMVEARWNNNRFICPAGGALPIDRCEDGFVGRHPEATRMDATTSTCTMRWKVRGTPGFNDDGTAVTSQMLKLLETDDAMGAIDETFSSLSATRQ